MAHTFSPHESPKASTENYRAAQPMTGFEQTRLSWARRVESFADAPALFHDTLRDLGATDAAFPYTVLTPTYEGFLRRLNPKMVLSHNETIYILENIHKQIVITRYPIRNLVDFELGSILLKSWITLRGLTDTQELHVSKLEFNSVTERLFTPFLNQIRHAGNATEPKARRQDFDNIPDIPLKFINYATRSVLADDRPVATIWQPEMRTPRVSVLGKTWYRMDATAHIVILTPRELIIIREDEQERAVSGSRYGGVWQYLALPGLDALTLQELPNALALYVHLPQNIRIETQFDRAKKDELEKLIGAFAAVRSAQAQA